MKKIILGVAGGLVTWIVVATIGNRLLRAGVAGYTDGEATMTFTRSMLFGRLVLGAVSTLIAGYVAAWLSGSSNVGAKVLAGVLLVLFVPMHIALWAKFPAWYHLVFLASLVVFTLVGAKLRNSQTSNATLPTP